jgi:hypothetical protein
MEVIVPENISDITLQQFQQYNKLIKNEGLEANELNKRLLSIFTNLKHKQIDKIKVTDYDSLLSDINTALNKDAEFKSTFTLDGIEFGFITNFDDITSKEWFDLNLYKADDISNYHKLMAIIFRPIISKDNFGNYKLETYNGTAKYSDKMKYTPMNIVNGALVFFSSLANELSNHIKKSITVQQKKETAH